VPKANTIVVDEKHSAIIAVITMPCFNSIAESIPD
jgi:hypothetical protein